MKSSNKYKFKTSITYRCKKILKIIIINVFIYRRYVKSHQWVYNLKCLFTITKIPGFHTFASLTRHKKAEMPLEYNSNLVIKCHINTPMMPHLFIYITGTIISIDKNNKNAIYELNNCIVTHIVVIFNIL